MPLLLWRLVDVLCGAAAAFPDEVKLQDCPPFALFTCPFRSLLCLIGLCGAKASVLHDLNKRSPALLQGFFCTAYGIRTRITTVKGWCPSP